ncbi:MAG: ATP-binding cassette domain-containing protein [Candidatus Bipolaricaulia bacterium]
MSIVTIEDLAKQYGAQQLFSGVTTQISREDKIGLIGDNGTGKSTLLRIIADLDVPSSGDIHRARSIKIGYLPQEPEFESNGAITLFDAMQTAFGDLKEMERELHQLAEQMSRADTDASDEVLKRYGTLLEHYEHAGGYRYENEIQQVLSHLRFSEEDWHGPIRQLSGGQKARASLAKLILESPDLLLLDEPTNHLDFAALEWLEEYLAGWKGSLVIVAHDRLLLDKLTARIWELAFEELQQYSGNYTQYLKLRDEQREHQLKLHKAQQAYIETTEEFIRRTLAGQKHKQAKDREKKLVRLERIEAPHTSKRISFTFDLKKQSHKEVLSIRDLVVGYEAANGDDRPNALFHCPHVKLYRGERIALIGPNGSGKTSFLKTIMGELKPLTGNVKLGQDLEIAHFAQIHEDHLGHEMTPLDVLIQEKSQTIAEARNFLGRFLFSGDDVFKKLQELSGGELSRVALARLAQMGGNLLLLDEPTNHLDISSQEILHQALEKYQGTMVLISHDRYLIDRLATQIWEIRDGKLWIYPGSYSDYRHKRKEETQQTKPQQIEEKTKIKGKIPDKEEKQLSEVKKREEEEIKLIKRIAILEKEIEKIERKLEEASYAQEHERIAELNTKYKLKKKLLEEKFEQWNKLVED